MPQLSNIAAIMNCYPNLTLKMVGYTDNVGVPASNLTLSQTRANNTVAAIVSQGISPSRSRRRDTGTAPGGEQRIR